MAYPTRRSRKPISDPASIALLASGIRQELLDSLESLGGEAEVAELARQLGRPADGLYYHLDLLAKGGLLEAMESGGTRRYRLRVAASEAFGLDYRSGGKAAEQASVKVVGAMLKIAARDFRQALARPGTSVNGPRRELWASRMKGWVDAGALAEVNALLARLNELLSGPRQHQDEQLVSLCFVLAPVQERPLRRGE